MWGLCDSDSVVWDEQLTDRPMAKVHHADHACLMNDDELITD